MLFETDKEKETRQSEPVDIVVSVLDILMSIRHIKAIKDALRLHNVWCGQAKWRTKDAYRDISKYEKISKKAITDLLSERAKEEQLTFDKKIIDLIREHSKDMMFSESDKDLEAELVTRIPIIFN